MSEEKVFCEECRKLVNYEVRTLETIRYIGDFAIDFNEKIATCCECGCEVYVDKINDENLDELYKQFALKRSEIKSKEDYKKCELAFKRINKNKAEK